MVLSPIMIFVDNCYGNCFCNKLLLFFFGKLSLFLFLFVYKLGPSNECFPSTAIDTASSNVFTFFVQ